MLDKKSIAVLKALNKLAGESAYKVVTSDEIINTLVKKSQYDPDAIKQIMDFLEKQEYINIKFSEENTFCYSILPKGRIVLEQSSGKITEQKKPNAILQYVFVGVASFVGSLLALIVFFLIFVI